MLYRLLCFFLLTASAIAQVTFEYTSYPTASGAHSLVAADFNHDGNLDVVVANGEQGISVFLGAPGGSFQPRVDIPTIWSAGDIVVADFNGDGHPDLAVANWGYFPGTGRSVEIFLGNGDGTFQRPYEYEVGNFPASVVAGDFNNDGIPDLATADVYDGKISILLGIGDGNFQPRRTFSTFTDNPSSVMAGDFNGDGLTDLLVQNDGSVSAFLGDSQGNFENGDRNFATPAFYFTTATTDFNGDGTSDLAMAYTPWHSCYRDCLWISKYAVWLGRPDGSFKPLAPVTIFGRMGRMAVADFNGDGKVDLAFALGPPDDYRSFGTLQVVLGAGDGTFQPGGSLNVRQLYEPYAMIAGDVDGDGKPDLLILDGSLLVFLNTTPWPQSNLSNRQSGARR